MTRLNLSALARRFKITRQALGEQLGRPDAPKPDDAGLYVVADVEHYRKGRARQTRDGKNPYVELAIQRARLTEVQADLAQIERDTKRGLLVSKEEIELAEAETASLIQSDIFGWLPLELAGKLSGRIFTAAEVRLIVRASVDLMVRQWVKGERVPESSIPQTETQNKKGQKHEN